MLNFTKLTLLAAALTLGSAAYAADPVPIKLPPGGTPGWNELPVKVPVKQLPQVNPNFNGGACSSVGGFNGFMAGPYYCDDGTNFDGREFTDNSKFATVAQMYKSGFRVVAVYENRNFSGEEPKNRGPVTLIIEKVGLAPR